MLHIAIAYNCRLIQKKLVAHFENEKEIKFLINASNGHDLILEMQSLNVLPDIVFMGINMPVMDGMATTYYLKLFFPSVKVIGLSIYDDMETITHIMECGARGYILKEDMESVLDVALSKVSNGERYIDDRAGLTEEEKNNILINGNMEDSLLFDLTPRERSFIIFNATTLTYEQIAEALFVETKTIHTYFDRVSKKLNMNNRQSLTIFSLQNGLAKLARYRQSA